MVTKKVGVAVVLGLVLVIGGSAFWYSRSHSDAQQAKSLTSKYLSGLYSAKTDPTAMRNMSTRALKVAKEDSELKGLPDSEKHFDKIYIQKVTKENPDVAVVTGTAHAKSPKENNIPEAFKTSKFEFRLVREDGSWKVDAFLVR